MNSEVETEGNCCEIRVTHHSVHAATRWNEESNASVISETARESRVPEMQRVSDKGAMSHCSTTTL